MGDVQIQENQKGLWAINFRIFGDVYVYFHDQEVHKKWLRAKTIYWIDFRKKVGLRAIEAHWACNDLKLTNKL